MNETVRYTIRQIKIPGFLDFYQLTGVKACITRSLQQSTYRSARSEHHEQNAFLFRISRSRVYTAAVLWFNCFSTAATSSIKTVRLRSVPPCALFCQLRSSLAGMQISSARHYTVLPLRARHKQISLSLSLRSRQVVKSCLYVEQQSVLFTLHPSSRDSHTLIQ